MNGEKPKMKPWKDIAEDCRNDLLVMEQTMEITRAILTEAESHIKDK